MSSLNVNEKKTVRIRKGEQLAVVAAAGSTGTVKRKARVEGGADVSTTNIFASQTLNFGPYANDEVFEVACTAGSLTESVGVVDASDVSSLSSLLGAQAAQPAAGSVGLNITRVGFLYRLDFTLNAARMTVTDAAGSGSHGSLKLFDFAQGVFNHLGCRQDYTAFAESAELTTAAGDAVFDIGVGTVAKAAAADGALGGATDDDIGGEIAITLSEGTGVGTTVTPGPVIINGTASAGSINLNLSGTAATIDATGTIDITGTISLLVAALGDD
jgi:hypothetical protein